MKLFYENKESKVETYTYHESCPICEELLIKAGGEPVQIYKTNVAYFACISFEGSIEVSVEAQIPIQDGVVKPQSRKIDALIRENWMVFTLTKPANLSIEMKGMLPLFFFANPLESEIASPSDPNVYYFHSGEVYEVGELRLKDNQTVYIEGGAVVRGCIRAEEAENVKICGRGILDGSCYKKGINQRRTMLFDTCRKVEIQDVILIEPSTWMVVLGNCSDVIITNLKEIGEVMSSDGIDIVGSRDVTIRGCFLRNNDDCIVLKATEAVVREVDPHRDWTAPVENIWVEDCVLVNDRCGNALEIGYELQTERVRNVVFKNCDILCVHGHGAAFSIHNGDRATVSNILYENIRVEHFFDKLIDFRVLNSRYNKDKERGQIRNIRFKDIYVTTNYANAGHSISLMGGYNPHHTIEGVIIENFNLDDTRIENADQLDLYLKNAHGIEFR